MIPLAVSSIPKNWFTSGSATKNSNGTVTISSASGSADYIYMPVSIPQGGTVSVNVTANVRSGVLCVYTNEGEFSGTTYNKRTESITGVTTTNISHTVKLTSDKPVIVYVKVGSDSSVSTVADIVSIQVSVDSGGRGALRDVAFGLINLQGTGSASVHDKYAHCNITSAAITPNGLEVVFDDVFTISSSSQHQNILPLISVSLQAGISFVTPKIIEYEQYTRKVTIKFYNFTDGLQADANKINGGLVIKAQVV